MQTPSGKLDHVSVYLADTFEDFLQVLAIRNTCCKFMTNHSKPISLEEQHAFFRACLTNPKKYILYLLKDKKVTIGYGFIKNEENRLLLTGAIVEEFRGQGYGKFLFQVLIEDCKKYKNIPICLEVRRSNKKAYGLYKSLGFQESNIEYRDSIIYMELKNDTII